ncbi:hypothetical protein DP113_18310 [Brasilonema octagenarum UFV-E1]|uniref:Uncharacterized protein n=2 Tax=Brasilonema TaxID=383614 RepID=A0A856MKZ0_9CYAN|nr:MULTISPECIES: hypothetical protein [Brasilonema]NMF61812.1 hypothetical protein [Brasilonema octagenarum UFV-OR1]QDL09596.1 hypothetical protein DP114_18375 [Brasilonema sennae CENA114]QDL15952.1 hypothetical protein DP113_18310 [Brasilonema octagenarum UFV-E1]
MNCEFKREQGTGNREQGTGNKCVIVSLCAYFLISSCPNLSGNAIRETLKTSEKYRFVNRTRREECGVDVPPALFAVGAPERRENTQRFVRDNFRASKGVSLG